MGVVHELATSHLLLKKPQSAVSEETSAERVAEQSLTHNTHFNPAANACTGRPDSYFLGAVVTKNAVWRSNQSWRAKRLVLS